MVSGVSPAAGVVKASLNKNETNEHPTSNIERPTSNNVFCQFNKKTERNAVQAPVMREQLCPLEIRIDLDVRL
jgi:hypothetical protein